MKPYYNLPYKQHQTQALVDAFNADELFWYSLRDSRKRRRKTLLHLGEQRHRELDVLEFRSKRCPDDCVGSFLIKT